MLKKIYRSYFNRKPAERLWYDLVAMFILMMFFAITLIIIDFFPSNTTLKAVNAVIYLLFSFLVLYRVWIDTRLSIKEEKEKTKK